MDQLSQLLQDIWCEKIEIDIFRICLQYNAIGTTGIARHIHIPRTTLYTHIQKLIDKKLLLAQEGTQGKVFSCISYENLIALLHTQKNAVDELIEKAQTTENIFQSYNKNTNLPKVVYYEWSDIFDLISKKVHDSKQGYYITNIDEILRIKGRTIDKLIQQFSKNTASIKEIIYDSIYAKKYIAWLSNKHHQIKILPVEKNHNLLSDIGLVDWFYYHIAFDTHINAIEIHNSIFYETQKRLFEELWDRL